MREIIFLNEGTPLDNLNEEVLLEGKIMNAVRWRLAKFTLRFLKESAIDEFLKAYYTDKDGKLVPKGEEWLNKSKKEKIKKLRDLADNLSAEDKEKVIKSKEAKRLEKQAAFTGLVASAAGVTTSVSKSQSKNSLSTARNAQYNAELRAYDHLKSEGLPTDKDYKTLSGHTVTPRNDGFTPIQVNDIQIKDNSKPIQVNGIEVKDIQISNTQMNGEPLINDVETDSLASLSSSCAGTASILYNLMVAALITTAIGGIGAILKSHRASVVRREEIMKELLAGKKNLKEDVELIAVDYLVNLLG